MGLLADIQKVLENWSVWQRISRAADKVDLLEARIAALESRLTSGPPKDVCPRCGAMAVALTKSVTHPRFGHAGLSVRTYTCSACGFHEDRNHDPSKT